MDVNILLKTISGLHQRLAAAERRIALLEKKRELLDTDADTLVHFHELLSLVSTTNPKAMVWAVLYPDGVGGVEVGASQMIEWQRIDDAIPQIEAYLEKQSTPRCPDCGSNKQSLSLGNPVVIKCRNCGNIIRKEAPLP